MKPLEEIQKDTQEFFSKADKFLEAIKKETQVVCAWCGEKEKVYGQFGRCDSGECFCSDQCKADYKKEHPLAE